jgi:prepilin-type N-terminal cleavage/methylation domain-containing protein
MKQIGERRDMKHKSGFNRNGITLIELLVVLVISGMVIAGIYRVFILQTRAYTVQDQVVEIQQSVRSAMEILLRDLRMAGCDDDNPGSVIQIVNPIVPPVSANSITVNYEYYDRTGGNYENHQIAYSLNGTNLRRQLAANGVVISTDDILENVDTLDFTYGIDPDENGVVNAGDWVVAGSVGTNKIIAVRATLQARPTSVNPDVQQRVSPRTLTSTVSLRNSTLIR